VKTITIRLSDVKVAMLVEAQKVNRTCRDVKGILMNSIYHKYVKLIRRTSSKSKVVK